jgi:hypothetical protein
MKSSKEKSFYQFLRGYASLAADRIRELVNFDIDMQFPQRKLVEFGQVFSRIVSMELVLSLENSGFRKDLIENALISLKQEISTQLKTFHFQNTSLVVVDYNAGSFWFDYSDK